MDSDGQKINYFNRHSGLVLPEDVQSCPSERSLTAATPVRIR
jgi:hypothetical protein